MRSAMFEAWKQIYENKGLSQEILEVLANLKHSTPARGHLPRKA